MAKKTTKAAKKSSGVKVRDMKPRKDAKGGLLPAVSPQANKIFGSNTLSFKGALTQNVDHK